jgi:hypothetical protein
MTGGAAWAPLTLSGAGRYNGAVNKSRKASRARGNGQLLGLAAARGLGQALDVHAYERAYELQKDPAVQEALDVLLDRLLVALRRRRGTRSG